MEEQAHIAPHHSPMRVWLLTALILVALGGGAFWNASRQRAAQTANGSDDSEAVKSVVHLDSFVVNLADTDQAAFLRVGIDLGIGQVPKGRPGLDKGSLELPKVRDAILTVLTASQSSDLLAADGKTKLKQRLVTSLNQEIPELPVKEVYFTEFLVQR
jgi:flagellar basal body-associated protein FliL